MMITALFSPPDDTVERSKGTRFPSFILPRHTMALTFPNEHPGAARAFLAAAAVKSGTRIMEVARA